MNSAGWRGRPGGPLDSGLCLVSERAHLIVRPEGRAGSREVPVLSARRDGGKESCQMFVLVRVSMRHYYFSFKSEVHRR